jgi:putative membrane protein
MSFRKETAGAAAEMPAWPRNFLTILFFAAGALVLARLVHTTGKPDWPAAVLLLLAVASTLAALARHMPLQNVLSAAGFIGIVGGTAEWLDLKTGIPFGQFTPGTNAGPEPFSALPWALPFVWAVAILNSRGVARLILRPWRKNHGYGFWLIGVTAALTALFDLALEPFASRVNHFWFWVPVKFPMSWQGVPLANFLGWLVVTLLILAFATPMLINKQPQKRRPPDFHPLGVWLGGILLFAVAAALNRLWAATAADAVIGIVTAVFAIRGARW